MVSLQRPTGAPGSSRHWGQNHSPSGTALRGGFRHLRCHGESHLNEGSVQYSNGESSRVLYHTPVGHHHLFYIRRILGEVEHHKGASADRKTFHWVLLRALWYFVPQQCYQSGVISYSSPNLNCAYSRISISCKGIFFVGLVELLGSSTPKPSSPFVAFCP